MISESFRLLYGLVLGALFLAVSVNRSVYPLLHLAAGLALVPLWGLLRPGPGESWKTSLRRLRPLVPPLAFMLYVAVSPGGRLFTDLPIATIMFSAFLCGMGVELAASPGGRAETGLARLAPAMLVLLGSLAVQAGWYFLSGQREMLWDFRLALLFDHPNALGYVVAWAVLFALVRLPAVWCHARRWAWVWGLLVLVGLVILALAGSRGVFVGLVLGGVPVLLLVYRRWAVPVLLLGVLACGLTVAVLPERHQARLLSALRNPAADVTIMSRWPIWDAALDGFARSPLLGNGLRSFARHHEAYVREHRASLEARGPVTEDRVANPHSLYLGMLYAYGLVGSGLAVLCVGDALRRTLRRRGRGAAEAFYLASMLFVLGAGVVDHSLHRKDGVLLLMIPLGMLYAGALRLQYAPQAGPPLSGSVAPQS